MGIFKTLTIAGGATVIGGILILGYPAFSSWARTSARMIREHAHDAVPTSFEIERIQTQVDDLDEVVAAQQERLIEQRIDLEYLDDEVERCRTRVDHLTDQVTEARRLLAEPRADYTIGGTVYPHERVAREARAKAEALVRARAVLEAKDDTRQRLAAAMDQAEAQIAAASQQRQAFCLRLSQLRAQAENIAIRSELATTLDELPASIDTGAFQEVEEAFRRVEKDLAVQDKLLASRLGDTPTSDELDFVAPPPEDVLSIIDEALHPGRVTHN